MSKIVLAFYNGLFDKSDPNKVPCWYESIVRGLRRKGHSVFLWQIDIFSPEKTFFSEDEIASLKEFAPDICLSFNNVLPDTSVFLSCPVFTIIVDSIMYLSNTELLDNRQVGCFQHADKKCLVEKYNINEEQVFVLPPFSEIKPDASIIQDVNISFIGTRFGVPRRAEIGFYSSSKDTIREYCRCIEYIMKNPLVDEKNVLDSCNVQSEFVRSNIVVSDILNMLSVEKRVRTLSNLVDLGLELYGTRSWLAKYHFDSRLNIAYVDKEVFSIEHNQNIYNRTKIGLNVSHLQAVDGFPWRVLDILSSNACLVTDWHDQFKTRFDGLYFPVFRDEHEARDICKHLLDDEDERRQIVEESNQYVARNFSIDYFFDEIARITGIKLN